MAKSVKASSGTERARKIALERLGGMMLGERRDPRDRLLHDRVRLGVVSALAVSGSMSFALRGASRMAQRTSASCASLHNRG